MQHEGLGSIIGQTVLLCETGMISHKYKVTGGDPETFFIRFEATGNGFDFVAKPVRSLPLSVHFTWQDPKVPCLVVSCMSGEMPKKFKADWEESVNSIMDRVHGNILCGDHFPGSQPELEAATFLHENRVMDMRSRMTLGKWLNSWVEGLPPEATEHMNAVKQKCAEKVAKKPGKMKRPQGQQGKKASRVMKKPSSAR